jgi:hypothetical protein
MISTSVYTVSKSLSEVQKRANTAQKLIHLDKQKDLYERIPHEDYILVDYSIVPFFKKYRAILIATTNYMITRYLEKINFVPRIAEKSLAVSPVLI